MSHVVRFGSFELDMDSRRLKKRGVKVKLRGQSFQVLASLLEQPGRVVTRDDLRRRLWRNEVFVDFENNLNIAVAHLREALCDSAEHPRFIETLRTCGYRFIGDVQRVQPIEKPACAKMARLLVLPFMNLSGDPGEEYFSDAMTDEIITAISGIAPQHLAVIARTTAMHYKGSRKDVDRIGRELGVDYVVEGSVSRNQDQVGINAQLIQTSDQAHVFAKRYETVMRDLFVVHSEIAQDIAKHTRCVPDGVDTVPRVESLRKRKPTEDLVAYNLYLQGRYLLYTDVAHAKGYFEKAIARDSQFALAYAGLGECYWWIGFLGLCPWREALSSGLWAALRAIELDNTLAETHALLGTIRKSSDYNWTEVQREMDLALKLNPASATVRLRRALSWDMPMGRLDEAVADLETGLELDPMDPGLLCWLGCMHWLARQYDRAEEIVRQLFQLDPNSGWAYSLLGQTRCMQHRFEEAVAALRSNVDRAGGAPDFTVLVWFGFALARSGNVAEARSLLNRLHERAQRGYVMVSCFAWIHLGLGEIDEAFVWMERAVEQFDPMMAPIKSYPHFDPLRSDPRFVALLRKMNLET